MAVAEIGNLATTLLNQVSAQDHNASANTPPAVNAPATNANVLPVDRFTPSAQQNSVQTTAQQAGLFQVAQFSTVSVAVTISQTQPAPPQAPPAHLIEPVAAPTQAARQIAAPATAVTTAVSVQDKLQALNIALAALGLSNPDIQSLDRVASIVKDFNPVAYRNLAFQLQMLAQKAPPQAATDAGNATTGANSNGKTPANQAKAAVA